MAESRQPTMDDRRARVSSGQDDRFGAGWMRGVAYRVLGVLLVMLIVVGCGAPTAGVEPTAVPQASPVVFETVLPAGAIEALDHPRAVPAEEARALIGPFETVMGLSVGGESRAYPVGLLLRHEIANDTLGGEPIMVTFCPVCNTGIAASRTVTDTSGAEQTLMFRFSGKLLDGAQVMQDDRTGTLWSQARFMAVEGPLAGVRFRLLTATQTTWEEWVAMHPDTELVVDEQAAQVSLGGANGALPTLPTLPQPGDESAAVPQGTEPTEYVLGVASGEVARAYALPQVAAVGVVNDEVTGMPPFVLVALGEPGAVAAWSREVEGEVLQFRRDGTTLKDETGSEWDARTGTAVVGPLAGRQLQAVESLTTHWLGWKDLYPETEVWVP